MRSELDTEYHEGLAQQVCSQGHDQLRNSDDECNINEKTRQQNDPDLLCNCLR